MVSGSISGADRRPRSRAASSISASSRSRPSIEERRRRAARASASRFSQRARAEDVTVFTRDLALLLKAGARLDDALELLATDIDIGRLRPTVGQDPRQRARGRELRRGDLAPSRAVSADVCGAGARRRGLRHARPHSRGAGAASARAPRRCAASSADALRYPAFVLFAAGACSSSFCCSCCRNSPPCCATSTPSSIPVVATFIGLSDFLRAHCRGARAVSVVRAVLGGWLLLRRPGAQRTHHVGARRGCRWSARC